MEDSKLQEQQQQQQQQQPQDSPQGDAAQQQKQPPPVKEVIGKWWNIIDELSSVWLIWMACMLFGDII